MPKSTNYQCSKAIHSPSTSDCLQQIVIPQAGTCPPKRLINEVEISRTCTTHQDYRIFLARRHGPGVGQLSGYDHVASHGKRVGLLSQLNRQFSGHHHNILIMAVPVQVKMRACRKHRVIGNPGRTGMQPLTRGSQSYWKAIAAPWCPPQNVVQIYSQ